MAKPYAFPNEVSAYIYIYIDERERERERDYPKHDNVYA